MQKGLSKAHEYFLFFGIIIPKIVKIILLIFHSQGKGKGKFVPVSNQVPRHEGVPLAYLGITP